MFFISFQLTMILKHLFPVPKVDSRRIITFSNTQDFISFRHHTYSKDEHGEIKLKEIGPRFEMRRKFLCYKMKSYMLSHCC